MLFQPTEPEGPAGAFRKPWTPRKQAGLAVRVITRTVSCFLFRSRSASSSSPLRSVKPSVTYRLLVGDASVVAVGLAVAGIAQMYRSGASAREHCPGPRV